MLGPGPSTAFGLKNMTVKAFSNRNWNYDHDIDQC